MKDFPFKIKYPIYENKISCEIPNIFFIYLSCFYRNLCVGNLVQRPPVTKLKLNEIFIGVEGRTYYYRISGLRFNKKLRWSLLFLHLIYGPFTLLFWSLTRTHRSVRDAYLNRVGVTYPAPSYAIVKRRTVAWRIIRCRLRGDISTRLRVSGASTWFRYNSRHQSVQYERRIIRSFNLIQSHLVRAETEHICFPSDIAKTR